jgi:hypothetical protein
MENKAMTSDKIFDLMRNPFAHAKQDRASLKELLKLQWIVNTSKNPFSEESVKIDKDTFEEYGIKVPTWAESEDDNEFLSSF